MFISIIISNVTSLFEALTRTCKLWNRNPTFYPIELRVHLN